MEEAGTGMDSGEDGERRHPDCFGIIQAGAQPSGGNGKEDEIRRLLGLRVPKTVIARLLSVSRTALYDFIESRSIDTGSVRM